MDRQRLQMSSSKAKLISNNKTRQHMSPMLRNLCIVEDARTGLFHCTFKGKEFSAATEIEVLHSVESRLFESPSD